MLSNLSHNREKSLSTAADVGERMNISSAKDAQVGKCAENLSKNCRMGRPTES